MYIFFRNSKRDHTWYGMKEINYHILVHDFFSSSSFTSSRTMSIRVLYLLATTICLCLNLLTNNLYWARSHLIERDHLNWARSLWLGAITLTGRGHFDWARSDGLSICHNINFFEKIVTIFDPFKSKSKIHTTWNC